MTACAVPEGPKRTEGPATPPTACRALAALTKAGRAHRPGPMNAFAPCRCKAVAHTPVMAICDDCGTVEAHAEAAEIDGPGRHVLEIHGRCGACAVAT